MKSIHTFKTYWMETSILTQQQKQKFERGHNSAKIWQMISNIDLELYFTKK